MKRILSFSLALLTVAGLAACGSATSESTGTSTAATAETTAAETERSYAYYGDKNYEGYTYTFLNYDAYCKTNLRLAPEEMTGETLNDAMYERNQKVEDQLNVKLVEEQKSYTGLGGWGTSQAALCDFVSTSVMAGDYLYDVASLPIKWKSSLMTDGYLANLADLPQIHLDESWWDTDIVDSLTIAGKSYLGSSPFSLSVLDLTWCLLFNEDMMTDLKLEYPYDLVREGKWTLDKMLEYVSAGTNLNGDTSFDYTENGKAVYGIAAHSDSMVYMVISGNNPLVVKDSKGNFTIGIDTERIYNAIEKVQDIYAYSLGHSTVGFSSPNSATENSGYLAMFRNDRTLFMTCEIKSALEERDMESDFGLLPFPKYDEDQENYYGVSGCPCLLTIPVTQKDMERTALVLDALSFESEPVMEAYYYTVVGQKGLRNQDSEEMLDVIRSNWKVEFAEFFSITTNYTSELNSSIRYENATPASLAASHKSTIEGNIKSVTEAFSKAK